MKKLAVIMFVAMMSFVMLTGCGGGKESEEISEVSSTSSGDTGSDVASEEVSEPVFEETTGEVVSEEILEETMDLTPYSISNGKFVVDLVADMEYDELKIIVWGEDSAKKILSDGDIYEIEKDDSLYIYYPQKMSNITANIDDIEIFSELDNVAGFGLTSFGENIEVTFTATDVNGEEYKITVYFTQKLES